MVISTTGVELLFKVFRRRHIAVDTQGLPHAIHVTTADVTDRAGALAMFDRRRDGLSQVQHVLVDGGYTGKPFATAVQSLLGAAVEVVKRNKLHTFVVLPKRWVVERSFAWLEKCRRLWKNCERKLNTSLQMVTVQTCGDLPTIGPIVEGQPSTVFPLQTVSVPSNVNSYCKWWCLPSRC